MGFTILGVRYSPGCPLAGHKLAASADTLCSGVLQDVLFLQNIPCLKLDYDQYARLSVELVRSV